MITRSDDPMPIFEDARGDEIARLRDMLRRLASLAGEMDDLTNAERALVEMAKQEAGNA